ncbi:hypothetical protein [Mycobacteroides abscessus]|uniref:hypothetical protein n=1 Tax=Mycobacteroides abscessus TaxID=36809 RepID=UPI002106EEA0|nr:hypothetical protein [Mycobacteroides abscessus]
MNASTWVPIAVAVVAAVSAWGLAMWRASRHRSWDALSADLDLADKLAEHYPQHADWLRQSVAVRLKGRALSDSRPRADFQLVLTATAQCVFFVAGIMFVLKMRQQTADDFWPADLIVVIAWCLTGVFVPISLITIFMGMLIRYRTPGVSKYFQSGNKTAQLSLVRQLKLVHIGAQALPDALPSPSSDLPSFDESSNWWR